MKVHTRMLSALLAMVLVFSLSVPAFAAQDGNATPDASVTGEIRATLRLDYAQNLKA